MPYQAEPVISVVVPIYNSACTIQRLVKEIEDALAGRALSFEILLIDDNSVDDSWQTILTISEVNPCVQAYKMPYNCGQFVTTISGTALAKGAFIVHIDDDLEYVPKDILQLYDDIITRNLSVVFGIANDKYLHKGSRPILTAWRNKLLNFIWQKYSTDSFRIIRRSILFRNETFLPKVHFEAFIKKRIPFREVGYVPVSYNKRPYGQSNYRFAKKAMLFFKLSVDYIDCKHLLLFSIFAASGLSSITEVKLLMTAILALLIFMAGILLISKRSIIVEIGKSGNSKAT